MRTPIITTFALLLLASSPVLFAQNILTNGSLERPVASENFYDEYGPGDAPIPGWTIGSTGGINGLRGYWPPSHGLDCVDLHHSEFGPGSIYQDVSLTKGLRYRLSFDMAWNTDHGLPVFLGVSIGDLSQVFARTNSPYPFWQRRSLSFTATNTGVVRLTFREAGQPESGAPEVSLDNVRLEVANPELTVRVSQLELCWGTETNVQYQIQARSGAFTNGWMDVGAPVSGNGATNCLTADVNAGEPHRTYRVIVLP